MGDNDKSGADLEAKLDGITKTVEGGFADVRATLKAQGDETGAKLAASEARAAQLEKDLAELKASLEERRVSLPGVEDLVKDKKIRVGDFIAAAAIGRRDKAEAARRFPLVKEVSEQCFKRVSDEMMTRLLSTETDAAAGYLVPEQVSAEFVATLYAKTALGAVGARQITGLTGWPYKVNRQTGSATAYWVGEGKAITASDIAVGRISFTPRKAGVISGLTNEQLMFSSPNAMSIVEDDFRRKLALLIDLGAMEGTGGEYQPLGLASFPGIGTYNGVTDPTTVAAGRDLRSYHMLRIRHQAEEANIPMDSFGFVMHTKQKNILALENMQSFEATSPPENIGFPRMFGNGIITDEQLRALFGPIGHSTNFSSNLAAGSSSDGANVIAGNWPMFWSIFWGGMAILQANTPVVGPNNAFTDDLTYIRATMLTDSGPVRPGDFILASGFRTTHSGF